MRPAWQKWLKRRGGAGLSTAQVASLEPWHEQDSAGSHLTDAPSNIGMISLKSEIVLSANSMCR